MSYKKIVLWISALITMLLCSINVAFAETGEYITETSEFNVKVAIGLGAIDEYDAEKKITVADFKKAIDAVTPSDGLSSLYIENNKADSNEISCKDAAAVIVDLLGYGAFSDKKSTEKLSVDEMFKMAQKYNILDGVEQKPQETLTMKAMVAMLCNMLETRTVNVTYTGAKMSVALSKYDYLEDVMDMEYINGIVQTVRYSSIKEDEGTEYNRIVIDGIAYECDIDNFDEYIGMKVKALVHHTDDGDRVLVLFDKGKAIEISADDIEECTANRIKYAYGRTTKTVSLSGGADVLYNFSLLKDWTADDLNITQGRLVLIDNNNDGNYDVVKIEEYKSMYVFASSIDAEKISNSEGQSISISKLIEKNYPIFDKGKVITPENIPRNSVATYYLDKSGEVVRIYFNNEIAAGTVGSFDLSENTVMLEGNEYSYTDEIENEITKLSPGTSITVNINIYGEIAYFQVAKDSYMYGYMTTFFSDDGGSTMSAKIFTQANEFTVYDVASKLNLNGSSMSAEKAFAYNLNTGLWDEAGKISQIVKYKVNKDGKITSLRTAANYDVGQPERLLKGKDGVYTYHSGMKTITGDTRCNDLTKVFLIPTDLNETTKYKYGGPEVLTGEDITCQIYDIDEDRYAGVIVARIDPYGSTMIDDIGGSVYMVERTYQCISARDEITVGIKAHRLGEKEPTTVDMVFNRPDIARAHSGETITPETLQRGDIILVSGDGTSSAEMGNFSVWYRPGLTEPHEFTKQFWSSAATVDEFFADARIYAAGEVISIVKNGIIVNNKPKDTENYDAWNRIVTLTDTTPMYIVDKNNKYTERASFGDLREGDEIYQLYSGGPVPAEFIVYRNF